MFDLISGVQIPVQDVRRAYDFYKDTLNLHPLAFIEERWAGFRVGERDIWLVQAGDDYPMRPGGDTGVVFTVFDLDAAEHSLRNKGLEPVDKGLRFPSGARQLPYRDPDGNVFVVHQGPSPRNR